MTFKGISNAFEIHKWNQPPAQLRLGDYVLQETIGNGTFGKVKRYYIKTGHKVAVKIMSRQNIKRLDTVSKLRQEIQILSELDHPHVIHLYKVISTASDIFMLMEYAAGGELYDYIVKNGRLQADEARRFFQQIISGVEYCHLHQVVHRDLKPENLLLDDKKNIKIADFGMYNIFFIYLGLSIKSNRFSGLSKIVSDGEFLLTSCGSPNYAAPEVISGSLYAGPEVDVWSCGVILFSLLCASLPFDDPNVNALFSKIRAGRFDIPCYVNDSAADLIGRMLCVDPIRRATIKDVISHPWFNVNLPTYLLLSQNDDRTAIVAMEVVKEVAERYKVAEEEVTMALLGDNSHHHLLLAYNMIIDENRKVEGSGSKREFVGLEKRMEGVVKRNIIMDTKRAKWHLGIRSSCSPEEIMLFVYRSLLGVGMEWKALSAYRVVARRCPKSPHFNPQKISLQLFAIHEGYYLLDLKLVVPDKDVRDDEKAASLEFQRVSPSQTILFLETCSDLINALSRG